MRSGRFRGIVPSPFHRIPPFLTDPGARLATALSDRYRIERELGRGGMATVYLAHDESAPSLSPDRRWLADQSNESGQFEIYVRAFPGPGPKAVISSGGGREPVWNPNGRENLYRWGNKLMAAAVETGGRITVRGRPALFEAGYIAGGTNRNFDVHPDGNRFLFIKAPTQQRLVVRLDALAPERR